MCRPINHPPHFNLQHVALDPTAFPTKTLQFPSTPLTPPSTPTIAPTTQLQQLPSVLEQQLPAVHSPTTPATTIPLQTNTPATTIPLQTNTPSPTKSAPLLFHPTPPAPATSTATDRSNNTFPNQLSASSPEFIPPRLFGTLQPQRPLDAVVKQSFIDAAKFFATSPDTTSLEELKLIADTLPYISPYHFSSTLEIAHQQLKTGTKTRYNVIALFDLARGSQWIHTDEARSLWLASFCASSNISLNYNGIRGITKINPVAQSGATIFQKGALPTDPKPNKIKATQDLLHVINTEVDRGTYLGPFTHKQAKEKFASFISSTIFGIEDTTRSTTKLRLIHNLSSLFFSVNKGIPSNFNHKLDYTSVMFETINYMLTLSNTVWFGSADCSRGYRRFTTRKQDVSLQGLSIPILFNTSVPFFDGTTTDTCNLIAGEQYYWFDTTMPFGSRSAPDNFCAVSIAVRDLVRELTAKAGYPGTILAYVDDFQPVAPSKISAQFILGTLRSVLNIIQLPEEPSKAQIVSTKVKYLGLNYNGIDHTVTLPTEKRQLYIRYLEYFQNSRRVKNSDLDSMIHRLRHAASVLRAGRPFFLNLLNTYIKNKRHMYIQLSKTDREDIVWWIHILKYLKPKVIIGPSHWTNAADMNLFTDASKRGFGAFFNGKWFNGSFTVQEIATFETHDITINEFELLVVVFAISTWGSLMTGQRITFHCDNSASVASIDKQKSRVPVRIALLRHLYAIALVFSIDLRVLWISTKNNILADALSRFDLPTFYKHTKTYTLQHETTPTLTARSLLHNPTGPQNPNSPDWRPSY